MLNLREMPEAERPRERMRAAGAMGLSDADLLALLLGSGTRGRDVLRVAADVLPVIDRGWPNFEIGELEGVAGVGKAKAALIVAALEFARRRIRPNGVKVREARDIIPLVQHLSDRKQEHFVCISLNGAHEVIATRVVTIGLANATQVHPREVFSDPICDRACAVVVAHNHPSGSVEPSEHDRQVTVQLKKAGALLGIKLLDHVIFARDGFYSFAEHGGI